MELSIVTSATNGYGRYLGEWAQSILALQTLPAMVAVAHTASEREHVAAACRRLSDAGLRVASCELDGAPNVGVLRNAAVALSDTEWVMHFDCDDLLLPHCLDDVAALAPTADVVALGYERTGDLKAGPPNRTRVYSDSRGETTLRSSAPASGVSPFRRSFWERSPYRTDMAGGWDTALWLGFAHLGARFRATRRPCFLYRQHADSIFNTRRRCARRSAFVGRKLELLRQGANGVSVIIPWRDDGGHRAAALAWMERRYAALFPGWQVVRGECNGAWVKGAAVADALARATGLTLVIADADCAVDPAALRTAVELVQRGDAPWVVPHTLVHRLDEASTARVLEQDVVGAVFGGDYARQPYQGFAGGGIVVVDRAAYEAAGGIPQVFVGWGAEDEALALVLDALVGPHVRLPHDLWHLWHPPEKRHEFGRNRRALAMFRAARDDADRMWSVVKGRAGLDARRAHRALKVAAAIAARERRRAAALAAKQRRIEQRQRRERGAA